MPPIMEDKLLDLLVNVIAILLGGGIITAIIEWRRHTREKITWDREDKMLEIDIPRADIIVRQWKIDEEMSADEKLEIYENKLENKIRQIVLQANFVIRNTTAAEIVITTYDANILQIPPGTNKTRFYDLETGDLISIEGTDAIKLRPYASIARIIVQVCNFGKDRVLDQTPTTLSVETQISNGATIRSTTNLKIVPRMPDLGVYEGSLQPTKYIAKFATDEDLPF